MDNVDMRVMNSFFLEYGHKALDSLYVIVTESSLQWQQRNKYDRTKIWHYGITKKKEF
jgi:hypothetical protein